MRSPVAATARSTGRRPPSSSPASRRGREGKSCGVSTGPIFFTPALAPADLKSDPSLYLKGGDEKMVLDCFEEGLRHVGLGRGRCGGRAPSDARIAAAAAGLAAEGTRGLGVTLRRWRRQTEATDLGQPTAATRWRVSALPSTPLPLPGVGRPRWLVELSPLPGGRERGFQLEAFVR